MITTPQEYYNKLHLIQDTNKPQIAVLTPNEEKMYYIDLNERKIESPQYLSVMKDHYAETIYFVMDRFYDNIDLAETTCIVQYINAKNEPRIYAVPFYDITTMEDEKKIIFPWCIEGEATKAAGNIQYSFKFYNIYKDPISGESLFTFNLNTQIARSKILTGLDVNKDNTNYDRIASEIEAALERVALLGKIDIE